MSFKTEAQALSPRALWLPGEESGGTVTDESANSFDATNNGGVASGSGGPGDGLVSYMAFDGVDDFLDCTTLGNFGSVGLATATFGVWVRDPTGRGVLFGSFNDGINTAVSPWLNTTTGSNDVDGQVLFYNRDEQGSPEVQGTLDSPENDLVDGNWHFLVFRHDTFASTPTVAIRFDKTELTINYSDQEQLADLDDFDNPLYLGARYLSGLNAPLEVDVAGFVIFDTNLTDQQADDLYDAAFEGDADALELDHLDASPTLQSPTLAGAVHLDLLDAAPTFHTPELAEAVHLTALDASPTFHTLEVAAVAANEISLTHLDASPTFHTTELAGTIDLDHLDAGAAFHEPTVVAFVDLDHLDASATFADPELASSIALDHLDASPTFHTLSVTGSAAILLDLLDASPTFHTVTVAATTIDLDHLDAGAVFHTLAIFQPTAHAPGPTRVDVNPSTTTVVLNPSLTAVDLDPSITHVSVDQDRTTT